MRSLAASWAAAAPMRVVLTVWTTFAEGYSFAVVVRHERNTPRLLGCFETDRVQISSVANSDAFIGRSKVDYDNVLADSEREAVADLLNYLENVIHSSPSNLHQELPHGKRTKSRSISWLTHAQYRGQKPISFPANHLRH